MNLEIVFSRVTLWLKKKKEEEEEDALQGTQAQVKGAFWVQK